LYSVAVSAVADGNTAAADKAAVEQIPFMRLLREKSTLIKNFSKQQKTLYIVHARIEQVPPRRRVLQHPVKSGDQARVEFKWGCSGQR
jgi:hypothetical protein